jgi:hypothetical protein
MDIHSRTINMKNLYIGTESISVKKALATVRRNITWLQSRIDEVDLEGHIGQQIRNFYEKKLDTQKLAIKWLTQHINE